MKTYIVDEEKAGIRIDKAIGLIEDTLSRVAIQRLLDEGNILVNGKITKASYKTKLGDEIIIQKEEPRKVDIIAQDIPIEVLYEDEDIIVVNKPKGIVVHPANGNPDGTLVNAIMNLCGNSLSGIGGEIRPGIIHRLDKDTSGVLIIAKNDIAHINISNQIKNRQTKKIYIALVRGVIKENEATIDMPIGRSKKDRKKMAVTKDGKEAITHFKVLKRYDNFTLLEIKIDTGRTHQIRVHLAEIGYPIVGDYVYSNGKNPFNVEGQMLHARQIEFVHPTTGKEMKIEAPIPEYFQRILNEM
ncbi:MAG: RluA family pseudouridine synthase [Clostridia bacterium]|nr:RluA family pseudouridine synthase [Clostridia bacterium]